METHKREFTIATKTGTVVTETEKKKKIEAHRAVAGVGADQNREEVGNLKRTGGKRQIEEKASPTSPSGKRVQKGGGLVVQGPGEATAEQAKMKAKGTEGLFGEPIKRGITRVPKKHYWILGKKREGIRKR